MVRVVVAQSPLPQAAAPIVLLPLLPLQVLLEGGLRLPQAPLLVLTVLPVALWRPRPPVEVPPVPVLVVEVVIEGGVAADGPLLGLGALK